MSTRTDADTAPRVVGLRAVGSLDMCHLLIAALTAAPTIAAVEVKSGPLPGFRNGKPTGKYRLYLDVTLGEDQP